MSTKAELVARLRGSGQEHVLDDYDALTDDEKRALAHQICHCAHDFAHLNEVVAKSLHALNHADDAAAGVPVRPPPPEQVWDVRATLSANVAQQQSSAIWQTGLEMIAKGKVAVLMMAGGSGTRLGVTIPKGMFVCDQLPQGKSLFEIDCEKLLRTQSLAAAAALPDATAPPQAISIPLLIMTSEENDAATRQFFTDHAFFGLQPEQVLFFKQSSLPCYDEATGAILMAGRGRMCVAPGGNGGLYQALAHSRQPSGQTTLEELKARGVQQVQIFSVDNILARIADPLFFGYAAREKAHVVVKTVPKVGPAERVGVFAQRSDSHAWVVVEYTEIGVTRSELRDPVTGALAFNCGNIASHCCSVAFLSYAAELMQTTTLYHAARKTVVTRDGPKPAVKVEAFLFDMFQFCNDAPLQQRNDHNGDSAAPPPDRFRIMQINRQEEFAPIKNAEPAPTDTATTAAHLLLQLHTKWATDALHAAMAAAAAEPQATALYKAALAVLEKGELLVEVSPLVSLQGEGLSTIYAKPIAAQVLLARVNAAQRGESVTAGAVSPPSPPVVAVTSQMSMAVDERDLMAQVAHM